MRLFFFFNDTATTEIYTLSLHDALPIYVRECQTRGLTFASAVRAKVQLIIYDRESSTSQSKVDRKSTRLNSSHQIISYAVFCLKKKTHCSRPLDGILGQLMNCAPV